MKQVKHKYNMKKQLQIGAKVFFFCVFIIVSTSSLVSWIQGDVSYSLINTRQPSLVFPSVTVCPSQDRNPLMNLKIGGLKNEFNLSDEDINRFAIARTLSNAKYNLSQILNRYSYTKEDSFSQITDGQFV